jgi:hypothetical protein
MARSIGASTKYKRPRGRPPTTGKGVLIGGRWHDDDLAAIDAWREQQEDQPDRAEAVRRLVRAGLTIEAKPMKKAPSKRK